MIQNDKEVYKELINVFGVVVNVESDGWDEIRMNEKISDQEG